MNARNDRAGNEPLSMVFSLFNVGKWLMLVTNIDRYIGVYINEKPIPRRIINLK